MTTWQSGLSFGVVHMSYPDEIDSRKQGIKKSLIFGLIGNKTMLMANLLFTIFWQLLSYLLWLCWFYSKISPLFAHGNIWIFYINFQLFFIVWKAKEALTFESISWPFADIYICILIYLYGYTHILHCFIGISNGNTYSNVSTVFKWACNVMN